jgi:Lhr-like helicase
VTTITRAQEKATTRIENTTKKIKIMVRMKKVTTMFNNTREGDASLFHKILPCKSKNAKPRMFKLCHHFISFIDGG